MKYVINVYRVIPCACMYMFASMQVVFADDTEIFFTPASAAVSEKPNIMFIIDTSGSMGWDVSGTTDSRMEVVQDVMDEVLTDIANVNAGLMRFNNGKPGPVLFPVLDIDQEATPTAFQTVSDGANDGTEKTLLGTLDLTGDSLEFNGPNKIVGIRFEDLNIPQGATIISANVIFTAKGSTSGAADVIVTGEKVDSAAILNPVAGEFSSRAVANPTTLFETWTMEDWVDGDIYSTNDISNIIEEITSQTVWCGGNDLMLFFTSTGSASRVAYSKDGVDSLPAIDPDDPASVFSPRIKIEYSQTFVGAANKCMTSEAVSQVIRQGDDFEIRQNGTSVYSGSSDLEFYLDGSNAQKGVGMVFENIKVPQGASISYAYPAFTADENSVGTSDVNIELVNSDTVSSPANDSARLLLHNASFTTTVPWSIADNWVTGNVYQSEDISSIVSTVTGRPGWALDNNMAVFIRGVSGRHVADSFSGNAPKLHIGYKGIWEPGVNTIRDDLKAAVAALTPSGGTPISGTYAEAGAYFKGDPVFYGATRNDNRYSRVSHELSYSSTGTVLRDAGCTDANLNSSACSSEKITGAPNYESPIVESCQSTHIVYLTDGASNSHLSSTNTVYSNWSGGGTCSSGNGGNDCSVKMAAWLHTNDVAPNVTGRQVITTHMIGFGPGADPDLMQDMATAGGGGYYSPQDRAELVTDISKIISGIANVNSTFVTAGVTVNQYNRVTNNEERYFSLFTPVNKESWPGNIKRYKLVGSELVDANNALAIEPVSAEFASTAKSFWSATADGNEVDKGGAAEQLGLGRKVYSNIGSNNLVSDGANALRQTNNSITAALLGSVTAQRRDSILYWVSGYDVNDVAYDPADASSLSSTPARTDIGDPLHSQPALLQYNDSSGNLSSTRIYVGTNHGYLHSFDADNGQENWAFVPKDLLPRLDNVITNATTTGHSYGLDGSVALYLDDGNGNGAFDPGEKVYLYVGQRRGGSSYYALDITDPDSPKFMFQITNTGDYADMGQTWSKPIIAKMNLAGVNSDQLVMIFGGGYDDAQDSAGTSANTDTVGDNLYIADAYTGNLLWDAKGDALAHGGSAGPLSSMNSVPSDVSAFDLAGDGLIDHIYVTDTKAQVFRFDVDNSAKTIKGGRIAQMQDIGGAVNNRRFYYSADTALIRQVGESFIAVSVGSGYRAHPLDLTVDDAFYVIKDKGGLTGVFDMDATLADMQNITSLIDTNSDGVSDAVEILNDPVATKKGWYLDLSSTSGEKVLARSVTFNNAVLFTTYVPPSGVSSACEAAAGSGRLYALNILNGNPYLDTNSDGSLTENDRMFPLKPPGIPPTITINPPYSGQKSVGCVGIECLEDIVPPPTDGILGFKWKKVN